MDKDEMLKDLENNIRMFDSSFMVAELNDFIKRAIPALVVDLKENGDNVSKVKATKELIDKMLANKDLYKIDNNYDRVHVFYVNLQDYYIDDNNNYPVMVFDISIMFYDNTANNARHDAEPERYWDHKWKVKLTYDASTVHSTCAKCGANMEFVPSLDLLNCKYCGNKVVNAIKNKWRILDIEVVE